MHEQICGLQLEFKNIRDALFKVTDNLQHAHALSRHLWDFDDEANGPEIRIKDIEQRCKTALQAAERADSAVQAMVAGLPHVATEIA